MLKTRNLEGAEYWEAYRRHKCTGRPVISVGIGEAKPVQVEKPKQTKWMRRPGNGTWVEVDKD